MNKLYTADKDFRRVDFTAEPLPVGEYDNCTFSGCDLSGADLSHIVFSQCRFTDCNLGMAKLTQTAFREAQFIRCKLLGLRFENSNEFLFAVSFDECQLDLSSFFQRKLKSTIFKKCSLHEADFSEADLTGAVFDDCDLASATFDHTVLEKADLRTARNYMIHPESNRIKKARFSLPAAMGLLARYDIVVEQ